MKICWRPSIRKLFHTKWDTTNKVSKELKASIPFSWPYLLEPKARPFHQGGPFYWKTKKENSQPAVLPSTKRENESPSTKFCNLKPTIY